MSHPQGMSLAELAPGVEQILLAGDGFSARIALLGGQLLDYRRDGEAPLLYLSPQTAYQPGKAIRGGVPVCWPWFGAHPSDSGLPAHGVARQQLWRLADARRDGEVFHVKLNGPRHEGLAAELSFRIGPDGVDIALATVNQGESAQTVSAALHSYFAVSDIDDIELLGLENAPAHDKVADARIVLPSTPFRFDGEVDQIAYTSQGITLRDAGWKRDLLIRPEGSASAVVWNPAPAKAKKLADLPDADWRRFVCVETANAGDDARELAPGSTHILACRLHFSRSG
ncbi:D-hexose-6-phosphate mutarotase [Chromobacterium alticapitis]|uniref:Putative glucose-6-phosphate 1-epimerase n=1 Tax=Chromobacterium alticapitis TaxID=2073169 RepID=A0A2S5DKI8_9NEIS|nr:D-hexose-6-phosphate mutarotase [Chromobacterium alticapitis]POZ63557.1 D-hexose-6-phosphate mutarotase [Chromobacterium alticapitis]